MVYLLLKELFKNNTSSTALAFRLARFAETSSPALLKSRSDDTDVACFVK